MRWNVSLSGLSPSAGVKGSKMGDSWDCANQHDLISVGPVGSVCVELLPTSSREARLTGACALAAVIIVAAVLTSLN